MAKEKYNLPKIEEMLDAGVHFGHQVRRWNPKMEKYIFAQRKGIHVIDLEQTHALLKQACEAMYDIASQGGQIIFVGTKKQAAEVVKNEATRCGAFYVNERWLGGTITNFDVIKKNIDKLVEYKRKKEAGELGHYTKKERLLIDREIEKLERNVGGIVGIHGNPSAVFVIDSKREHTAVKEARIAKIEVFSLTDTNSDPNLVDYIIPGNDDAIRSILLVTKAISDAVEAGYKYYAENKNKVKKQEETSTKEKEEKESTASAISVTTSESPVATKESGKKDVKKVVKEVEEPKETKKVTKKEKK